MAVEIDQLCQQIGGLHESLQSLHRKLDFLMTTQAEFDANLAAHTTAVNALLAAYQTAVGGDVDLSAEDATVTGLTASINAVLSPAPSDPAPVTASDPAASDPTASDPTAVDPSADPAAPADPSAPVAPVDQSSASDVPPAA